MLEQASGFIRLNKKNMNAITMWICGCLSPDLHMGQFHVVVGIWRGRSDKKTEKANWQQNDPETQS